MSQPRANFSADNNLWKYYKHIWGEITSVHQFRQDCCLFISHTHFSQHVVHLFHSHTIRSTVMQCCTVQSVLLLMNVPPETWYTKVFLLFGLNCIKISNFVYCTNLPGSEIRHSDCEPNMVTTMSSIRCTTWPQLFTFDQMFCLIFSSLFCCDLWWPSMGTVSREGEMLMFSAHSSFHAAALLACAGWSWLAYLLRLWLCLWLNEWYYGLRLQ